MSRKKFRKTKKTFGIGPRLQQYREGKNLNQQEFSKLTSIPRSTLSEIENEISVPRAEILIKIICISILTF